MGVVNQVKIGDVLAQPVREPTTGLRMAIEIQIKKWAGKVSVVFNPGHRNGLEKAPGAVSLVVR